MFKKGDPRPEKAGRKPGSLNKRTMAEEACHKLGISPFELLAIKAQEGDVTCLIALCKHVEPPRKSLDVAIDPELNKIEVIIKRYGEDGQ